MRYALSSEKCQGINKQYKLNKNRLGILNIFLMDHTPEMYEIFLFALLRAGLLSGGFPEVVDIYYLADCEKNLQM